MQYPLDKIMFKKTYKGLDSNKLIKTEYISK